MYDFVIVGARCAGAALACFLGRAGYKVLLIDQYDRPGPTLSTHIIGETDVYDSLGIRKQMETAGAPTMTRMRVDLEGTVMEADMVITPRTLGLRRELFDAMLLKQAADCSRVQVMLNTRVTGVIWEGERVKGITCKRANGTSCSFYAKAIIGADGRHSLIAREVQAATIAMSDANHLDVVYAYLANVEPLPIPTVEWYWTDRGVVICNPIDQGLHCIALMLPGDDFSGWKGSLAACYLERIDQLKTLRPRLQNAQIVGKIRGVRRLVSYIRQPFGRGWALVGDAAAHLHPVAGVGIDNAVCSAWYLADELDQYMQGYKTWQHAMESYQQRRDERILPQYEASLKTLARTGRAFTDSASEQSLRMLCTFPSLVKALARRSEEVLTLLQGVIDE
ncbi:MAG: NAD(P)/FAD-dependent oxidoreductase [Brevibacillus sp.]|nr:NAD(P)/FAD-dependent oxidoreductase [Brevibacillus sp.]